MNSNNEQIRNVALVAAKIMDEALKGNQHKIDANKNGKVDAEDFKILRGEKKMKEEVDKDTYGAQNVYDNEHMKAKKGGASDSEAHEQASKEMKKKYPEHTASRGEGQVYKLPKQESVELEEGRMKDIYTDMQDHATKKGYSSKKDFTKRDYEHIGKQNGISGADVAIVAGHHTADSYRKLKEEAEQIDELSKKTLGSYVNKAHSNSAFNSFDHGADEYRQYGAPGEDPEAEKDMQDRERAIANREKGVARAVKRLTKEEQEFIDELNKSTLGSYINASARDAVHRTAQEVETGRLDKLADKRMKGIKLATKKLAKEETVSEGTYKHEVEKSFPASGVKTQPPANLPFTPDKEKAKVATAGKFGYGYSAARHLARQGMAGVTKEETVDEAITKTSTGYIHHARPGVYGGSEKEKHVVDTLAGPKKSELEKIEKEKKMKKFSEMLDLINTRGLKALSEMIKEEPDNEQFTKELKDQQAKMDGKKKNPDIAKGEVMAVKQEEVQVEVLDANKINGVEEVTIDERHLSEPEMEKREKIVKSMKKGLAGFKARYGDRAKSVMYATATKQAKGE